MKTNQKTSRLLFGLVAAGCALGAAHPPSARATVSDEDFNALKAMVQQMNGQLQSLKATNQADQEIIGQLQQKLVETQRTAVEAQQNSIAATQIQAAPRAPLDEATVNHNFQILGDAEFQYGKTDGQNGSFLLADFAPIFLYRGGDNILFEAGFDFILQNNAPNSSGYTTTVNLSFAQLDYVFNDYITLCAGNLVLPLGTYSERSAGWLNKFPDSPLAVGLIPGTGIGAELRGAIPLGEYGNILNYSVYGVNGPGSSDGLGNDSSLDVGGNVGLTSDGRMANLHKNLVGGGRLAVFMPLFDKPRYDLEVGLSAQSGEWDNAGSHLYTAGVLDAALHLGPNFEAKGEYILSRFGTDNVGMVSQSGWFVQAGYKLAGLNLEWPVINNVELVGRYDTLRDGANTTDRYTAGCVYYLTTALLFEGDYEIIRSSDSTQPRNQLILQMSYGF
ncbi:MAG: hypothetical protein P4N60_17945 [Verrucomicrobiae bacterium]|nr:hypothetical protein [Verrucomicrobiae bacterium]